MVNCQLIPFLSKYFNICFPLSYMTCNTSVRLRNQHTFLPFILQVPFNFCYFFSDVALILKPWVRFLYYISLSLQFRTVPQTCFDIRSLEILLEIILSYCTITLKLRFLHGSGSGHAPWQKYHRSNVAYLCILAGDMVPLLVIWLLPDNVSTVKRLFPLGDQQVLSGKVL